jgi:hypothetical protein
MPRTKLDTLKRKQVEVRANGFTYRGLLLEATESELTLKGETGFITISMDRVTSVIDPKERETMSEKKFVDPSFYNADLPKPDPDKP